MDIILNLSLYSKSISSLHGSCESSEEIQIGLQLELALNMNKVQLSIVVASEG